MHNQFQTPEEQAFNKEVVQLLFAAAKCHHDTKSEVGYQAVIMRLAQKPQYVSCMEKCFAHGSIPLIKLLNNAKILQLAGQLFAIESGGLDDLRGDAGAFSEALSFVRRNPTEAVLIERECYESRFWQLVLSAARANFEQCKDETVQEAAQFVNEHPDIFTFLQHDQHCRVSPYWQAVLERVQIPNEAEEESLVQRVKQLILNNAYMFQDVRFRQLLAEHATEYREAFADVFQDDAVAQHCKALRLAAEQHEANSWREIVQVLDWLAGDDSAPLVQ
jgi:hypothetical protein